MLKSKQWVFFFIAKTFSSFPFLHANVAASLVDADACKPRNRKYKVNVLKWGKGYNSSRFCWRSTRCNLKLECRRLDISSYRNRSPNSQYQ